MILHRLQKDGLIHPPKWLADNTQLLVVMGSTAYGVSDDTSDYDCYGFAIPEKDMVFPHQAGYVPGFGTKPQSFNSWQEHHVIDKTSRREYDFQIYSVVMYFDLLLQNNPNIVDSLFVPERCILHSSKIGDHVRENRKRFLHRGCYHKFTGYLYSQMKRLRNTKQSDNPKIQSLIDRFGYNTKMAYQVVRLALECQEILDTGDLHLDQNVRQLREIREGGWSLEFLEKWVEDKIIHLETAHRESPLPHSANEDEIKGLLLDCLEMQYGDLQSSVVRNTSVDDLIREMQAVLDKARQ